jgi:hypothetical protein
VPPGTEFRRLGAPGVGYSPTGSAGQGTRPAQVPLRPGVPTRCTSSPCSASAAHASASAWRTLPPPRRRPQRRGSSRSRGHWGTRDRPGSVAARSRPDPPSSCRCRRVPPAGSPSAEPEVDVVLRAPARVGGIGSRGAPRSCPFPSGTPASHPSKRERPILRAARARRCARHTVAIRNGPVQSRRTPDGSAASTFPGQVTWTGPAAGSPPSCPGR